MTNFLFKKIVFSNHYNIMPMNAVELILKKSQMDVIVKLIQLYLDFFLFRNHLRLVKFYTSYWEPETVSRSWCCKYMYMLKYMDILELIFIFISCDSRDMFFRSHTSLFMWSILISRSCYWISKRLDIMTIL